MKDRMEVGGINGIFNTFGSIFLREIEGQETVGVLPW